MAQLHTDDPFDQIEFSPWTLRFKKSTEIAFHKDYYSTTLTRTRIGIFLGVIFYALFYILDIFAVPDVKESLFIIRFAIVVPYILILFLLSFSSYYHQYQQALNSLGILIAGGGIVYMTLISPSYTFTYYAGIILVLIYAHLLMGIRFWWSTAASWLLVGAYVFGISTLTPIPMETAFTNYFFLVGANILLMFAGYFNEVLRRKDFLLRHELSDERKKVQAVNVDLETLVENRTAELVQEVAERKEAQKISLEALKEKEALLKEVYHRTKNNMNVIISLLNLQAHEHKINPSDNVFKQLADRIHSMSLVHEQLYGSENLSTIRLDRYIEKLCNQIRFSLLKNPNQVKILVKSSAIDIGLEQGVPLGLALNEIISNALVHGYPEGQEGVIEVSMTLSSTNKLRIIISNDGQLFSEMIDLKQVKTLGLRLVQILIVEQLDGEFRLETDPDTRFLIDLQL